MSIYDRQTGDTWIFNLSNFVKQLTRKKKSVNSRIEWQACMSSLFLFKWRIDMGKEPIKMMMVALNMRSFVVSLFPL